MRLLLLLSALLAALTGAAADARMPQGQVVAAATHLAETGPTRAPSHALLATTPEGVAVERIVVPRIAPARLAASRLWAERPRI